MIIIVIISSIVYIIRMIFSNHLDVSITIVTTNTFTINIITVG